MTNMIVGKPVSSTKTHKKVQMRMLPSQVREALEQYLRTNYKEFDKFEEIDFEITMNSRSVELMNLDIEAIAIRVIER